MFQSNSLKYCWQVCSIVDIKLRTPDMKWGILRQTLSYTVCYLLHGVFRYWGFQYDEVFLTYVWLSALDGVFFMHRVFVCVLVFEHSVCEPGMCISGWVYLSVLLVGCSRRSWFWLISPFSPGDRRDLGQEEGGGQLDVFRFHCCCSPCFVFVFLLFSLLLLFVIWHWFF